MARSRRFLILIILTMVIAVPVIWLSGFHSAAQAPCDAQYNALVKQAKAELINGDRTAALSSLVAARAKLRECAPPTESLRTKHGG